MADDDAIPIEFKALCTHCGAELQVERLGIEPVPEDIVFCPTHGPVGTRKEVDARVIKEGREQVVKQFGENFAQTLRDIGFEVERETR
jgi:hypothetical protein